MNYTDIIKKYIKLNVKRDDLTGIVVVCNKIIDDSQKSLDEGKLSESSYNSLVGSANYRKINASDELNRVLVLLGSIKQQFDSVILGANSIELAKILNIVVGEKMIMEAAIQELIDKRAFAKARADEAFKINSFYQEDFYNAISNECFDKIEDLTIELEYYKTVESDIRNKIALQNSQSVMGI